MGQCWSPLRESLTTESPADDTHIQQTHTTKLEIKILSSSLSMLLLTFMSQRKGGQEPPPPPQPPTGPGDFCFCFVWALTEATTKTLKKSEPKEINQSIKAADNFKYLGAWINDSAKDMKTRKAQALRSLQQAEQNMEI